MNVNMILFDDFEAMDVFVPASIFGCFPQEFHINYLSVSGDVINSSQGAKIWTDFLIPEEIDGIVLIPGGKGVRRLLYRDERFLNLLKKTVENAEACLMTGNGSMLLAGTGLLYRRLVAQVQETESWKEQFMMNVRWVPDVTWAADGKYYSCPSSMSAASMTLGYLTDTLDMNYAENASKKLGISWSPEEDI